MSNVNGYGKVKQLFMPEGVEIVYTDQPNVSLNRKPAGKKPDDVKRAVINIGFFEYSKDSDTFGASNEEIKVTLRVGFKENDTTSSLILYDDSGNLKVQYFENEDLAIYDEPWHGFNGYGEVKEADFSDPNIGWP